MPGYIFTISVKKVLKGEKNLWFRSLRKSDTGLETSPDTTDLNGQPSLVLENRPPAQASDIPVPKKGYTERTKVLVGAVADQTTEKIGKNNMF